MDTMVTTPPASTTPNQTQTTPTTTTPSTNSSGNADWFAHVPKGSEKVFESFKGKPLSEVLNSHVEAQKVIGGSIRLPKADAKPEEKEKALNDIFNKLGRPESPDKYNLGELPAVDERYQWDEQRLAASKAAMHKAGFTNDQVKVAMQLFAEEAKQFFPDTSKTLAESREVLIAEYGSEQAFQRNLGLAHQTLKAYGDADLVSALESTGYGNHPAMVRFMAKIGKELVEHGSIQPAAEVDYISVKEAQEKLDAIHRDKTDVYWAKPGTPGKTERIKEVTELHRIVAGEA